MNASQSASLGNVFGVSQSRTRGASALPRAPLASSLRSPSAWARPDMIRQQKGQDRHGGDAILD